MNFPHSNEVTMHDTADAFVATFEIAGAKDGPLSGLTAAIKDIYDVEGHVTGCGNPDWARTHDPAQVHSPAVAALLTAGATVVGKTHTDELAYSLMGVNAHYGAPINTADPTRVPGGSSSGSVAAVAAGLADIGLGSDTGGSVRMPAAFCGVYGLRTTHGALALKDTMPLAPSFDTVGWFTKNISIMQRVAKACGLPAPGTMPPKLLLPVDIWACAEVETVAALCPVLGKLEKKFGSAVPVITAPEGLSEWFKTFHVCQGAEAWRSHGAWIEATQPAFGPGVSERFTAASKVSGGAWENAKDARAKITARMNDLLEEGAAVMVLPTGPGSAPKRDAGETGLNAFRMRALEMLCPAGLAGLPQLSMPAGVVDSGPVGLSLIGAAGTDRTLLAMADITAHKS